MKFEEIDDVEWSRIEPLLPPGAKEGRPRADDRSTVNAVLFVLITGCRWIDVPKKYGDDSTANRRLRRWGSGDPGEYTRTPSTILLWPDTTCAGSMSWRTYRAERGGSVPEGRGSSTGRRSGGYATM